MNPPPSVHSSTLSVRTSACPGLLRIVSALDGGICRIKLPGGQLTAIQAEAIATAAARYASGTIEITNRANLQIRGIQFADAAALIAALLAAELGAATPGADDVRNLMLSPSAGIDPDAVLDTTPLARQILTLLQTQTRLHLLSPKFSISLDGGERLAMLEHPHDLWLSALPTTVCGESPSFVFGLAGCPAQSNALAAVSSEQVAALVEAVLHTFLDLATPEQARMRQLLQTISVHEFLRQLQLRLPFALSRDVGAWHREPAQPFAHIGVYPQRQPSLYYVGAVPPLGRIDAAQLRALAQLATQFGDGTLRLTPWQSVLLPNIANDSTAIVISELQQLGFSTQLDEPLAHLLACTGARGCAKGLADTKADALQLALLLQQKSLHPVVHLSGCARSCAAASSKPFTLLAVAEGRYDLYRRDQHANDCEKINTGDFEKPNASNFGKLLARDIVIVQALKFLENIDD